MVSLWGHFKAKLCNSLCYNVDSLEFSVQKTVCVLLETQDLQPGYASNKA